MYELVVDADVLNSIMIRGKSSYKPILTYFDFYSPDFVFEEIELKTKGKKMIMPI
jgi:predicted nucleic acid-binding protein